MSIRTVAFDPPELERFLGAWRFNGSQRQRLRQLSSQWAACNPDISAWDDGLTNLHSAKAVMQRLEDRLLAGPVAESG